jgi:very-short-patch-repair endonuclease
MSKINKNVLIAYMPSGKDLSIALNKHWYRIPLTTQTIPQNVKNKNVELIAFYQPKIFKEDGFAIRYYAEVKKIRIVKRKELFKDDPLNPKSENKYFKIIIDKLVRLPKSIISRRRRRILFITTTLDRFRKAEEINDLFYESPLEEKFWTEFKNSGILAERQFLETIGKSNFFLDFAIFCKNRNLDIECDGDTYHTEKQLVQQDKRRDNILESRGWNVLRYTTEDIEYKLDESIKQVKDTINHYGGTPDPRDEQKFNYFPTNSQEDTLFG